MASLRFPSSSDTLQLLPGRDETDFKLFREKQWQLTWYQRGPLFCILMSFSLKASFFFELALGANLEALTSTSFLIAIFDDCKDFSCGFSR